MAITLTEREQALLREILVDRLGTLREQIHHSMTSTFTDELKASEKVLRAIIGKVEADAPESHVPASDAPA